MRQSAKEVIKQFIPPFILAVRRSVIGSEQEAPDRRALRLEHERLNRDVGEGEIRFRPDLTLKLHPHSRVAFEAFCYGTPDAVAEMNCFLKRIEGKRNLLDVGALHGIFTLAFASAHPHRKAVAVDASPIAFARLLYNLHKNQLQNVTPVECALSDGSGVVRMHYEWEHAVAAGTTGQSEAGLSVVKQSGDTLCAALQFKPDVIKIDVEGHEVKVLNGMRATIQSNRPLVFLEIHPERIREEGDRLEDLELFFTDLKYCAESTAGEPMPLSAISSLATDQRILLHPG